VAKIPTGNFGNRLPQGNDITPTAQVDTQVSDAANRLGQTAAGIGASIMAEQEREARAAADRAAAAKTALAHVNIQNGLADNYDAISQNVLAGKMDKIEATAAWKDASAKVVSDNVKGAPPDRADLLAAQAKGVEGKLTNSLFDTFRKRDDQDAIAGVTAAEEGLQRIASKDLAGAIKQHGMLIDGSPLPPDVKAKRKQTFVETATYNDLRAQGQAAYQSGDTTAIDRVQAKLAGPEGEALDPAKKNVLDQTFFGWKQSAEAKRARLEDKAEREATKRYNTATDTLNQNRDLVLSGAVLAPERIALMVEQAQGTGLETQVREVLEAQKSVSGFANQTASQRAALLESARSARADPTKGATPESEKQLKSAEQIDNSLRQKVDSGEAWSAAQSVGVIPAAPLLNIGNPQQALEVFQQRTRDIAAVETWAGKKISPLQPQEAEQLQKMVRTLKPDQAASMLGQLGGVVNDADRIAAVAKQIGDKDGTLGMVMLYANAKTTEGRYTAELILQGDQAIKDKTIKVDGIAETGWRADIAKKVRGAYSNQEVESNIIEAAFKIAAAKGGDVDNAINLASGGIIERNGGKIPLPYGMKEREFEKRIAAITPDSLMDQVRPKDMGRGNIDLNARPVVKNADGSISTVRSIGVNIDGKETLLPSVSPDGKILSDKDAIALYRKTGQHLGKFDTVAEANAYAEQLHNSQDKTYSGGAYVLAGPARVPLADFVKTLPDARLIHAGQGAYNVRAGNTLVTNERGQRITIKVSP
jgi:hypothetical protein